MNYNRIYSKKWWGHLGITEAVNNLLKYKGTRFLRGEPYVEPVNFSDDDILEAGRAALKCIRESNNYIAYRALKNYVRRNDSYISSVHRDALRALVAWKESADMLYADPDEIAVLATLGSDAAKLMYFSVYLRGRTSPNESMG